MLLQLWNAMETELFAAVEAGDMGRFQELIKKETKETIDQVRYPLNFLYEKAYQLKLCL